MALRRHSLRAWCEYAAFLAVLGGIRSLPVGGAHRLLRALARFGYLVNFARRRAALGRVAATLGYRPESSEARAIVRGAFDTITRASLESWPLDKVMAQRPLEDVVTVEGAEHMQAALDSGRGVLIVSGHVGSWFSVARFVARLYRPIYGMVRLPNNLLVADHIERGPLASYAGTADKVGGARQALRWLKQGEIVAIAPDQRVRRKDDGTILDFLGRPAAHHTGVARMALRVGAVVLPTYCLREPGEFRYRLIFEPLLEIDSSLPERDAEVELTRRISRSLAARVRAQPDQYLWLHDRWRIEPEVEARSREGSSVPAAEGTTES
jgi:KDO2-lipid IV(A) lauroyltransferase